MPKIYLFSLHYFIRNQYLNNLSSTKKMFVINKCLALVITYYDLLVVTIWPNM